LVKKLLEMSEDDKTTYFIQKEKGLVVDKQVISLNKRHMLRIDTLSPRDKEDIVTCYKNRIKTIINNAYKDENKRKDGSIEFIKKFWNNFDVKNINLDTLDDEGLNKIYKIASKINDVCERHNSLCSFQDFMLLTKSLIMAYNNNEDIPIDFKRCSFYEGVVVTISFLKEDFGFKKDSLKKVLELFKAFFTKKNKAIPSMFHNK
ncbi:MAG: hypothetical protein II393_01340, partial [Cytophagales bacterium]|nr:hypothetical protein [Cytophagales bacterium]